MGEGTVRGKWLGDGRMGKERGGGARRGDKKLGKGIMG